MSRSAQPPNMMRRIAQRYPASSAIARRRDGTTERRLMRRRMGNASVRVRQPAGGDGAEPDAEPRHEDDGEDVGHNLEDEVTREGPDEADEARAHRTEHRPKHQRVAVGRAPSKPRRQARQ